MTVGKQVFNILLTPFTIISFGAAGVLLVMANREWRIYNNPGPLYDILPKELLPIPDLDFLLYLVTAIAIAGINIYRIWKNSLKLNIVSKND
jgi:hypothetical protein